MSAIFALTGQLAVRRDPALSDAAASGDFDIVTALSDSITLADRDSQSFTLGATPHGYDIDTAVIGDPNVVFIRASSGIGVIINGGDTIPDVTFLMIYVETGLTALRVTTDGTVAKDVRIIMGTLAAGASTLRAYHA